MGSLSPCSLPHMVTHQVHVRGSGTSANSPLVPAWKGTRLKARPLRVQFAQEVVLHCFGPGWVVNRHLPFNLFSDACRILWHLHGQVVDAMEGLRILKAWEHCLPVWRQCGNGFSQGVSTVRACCVGRSGSDKEAWLANAFKDIPLAVPQDCLSLLATRQGAPSRQRFFIETWFLAPQRTHVCLRPRRFYLTHDSTPQDFAKMSLWLWQDLLISGQDVQFIVVHPKPETLLFLPLLK